MKSKSAAKRKKAPGKSNENIEDGRLKKSRQGEMNGDVDISSEKRPKRAKKNIDYKGMCYDQENLDPR